jgi:hypothetical protein
MFGSGALLFKIQFYPISCRVSKENLDLLRSRDL